MQMPPGVTASQERSCALTFQHISPTVAETLKGHVFQTSYALWCLKISRIYW